MAIEIRELADCVDVAARIAEWHWSEWGPFAIDGTVDGLGQRLASWTNRDGVPCILVAFEDDEPVGSVSLVSHDMDDPEPRFVGLTPWLSGLFVVPDARRLGAGSALVTACERRAVLLGYVDLYLYTESAEGFYQRLGWETIAEADYEDTTVKVMRKTLSPK